MRRAVPWIVVAAAAALFLAPLDPTLVERLYSTHLYLLLQPRVTRISNLVPFALFDAVLAAAAAVAIWILAHAVRNRRRGGRWRAAGTAVARLIAAGAVFYLWFLAAWGLNYRRVPLSDRLDVAAGAPTAAAVLALGQQAVDRLNTLHAAAHATAWTDPWRDPELTGAYRQVQRYLTNGPSAVPGRFKLSLVGPYFRWASVDGMIDPFALEVLPNPDLLPFEKPFVAAHEWAHLAGYAKESEASFVGFLTCVRGSAPAQYSGWLFLFWEISAAVPAEARAALADALGTGPRADVAAVAERVRRGQLPRLRMISWAAYDQYLKANHVAEGVRSYDEVVTLLAQARFKPNWVPVPSRAQHRIERGPLRFNRT